jgi:hypothetical protein
MTPTETPAVHRYSAIQIDEGPERVEAKAIFLPSGEYREEISSFVEEMSIFTDSLRAVCW